MRMGRTPGTATSAVLSICLYGCGSGSSDGGGTDADAAPADDGGRDSGGADAGGPDDGGTDAGPVDGGLRGCVSALFGRYIVRDDGALLLETATGQTAILEAESGAPLADVAGVHDGFTHGCAVLGEARTAWCWRVTANGNAVGQLGNGTADLSGPIRRATQVLTGANEPLEDVVAISYAEPNGSIDARASCAVTAGGQLYCWGNLTWLANGGTTLSSPLAVPILTDQGAPLSGVSQAAAYQGYGCAVVAGAGSSELWCWGQNGSGEVGVGDRTPHPYPIRVPGLDSPSKVVAHSYGGYPTTCVLDGEQVRCWGENFWGEVGNDSPDNPILAPSLVTVTGGDPLDDVVDLHGGYANFCARRSDDTIWCWGNGHERYATAYPIPEIVALGGTEQAPRFLTSDGVYHMGNTARDPNCGTLP
jgi:hypothetical protein